MNNYLSDARVFLSKCAMLLKENMPHDDVLSATLFYAIGVERLLKWIIATLNPALIYQKPTSEQTLSLLYSDKLISSDQAARREFTEKPHVLSYRQCLDIAKHISITTNERISSLRDLGELRDIVVHRDLSEFDNEKANHLLSECVALMQLYAFELDLTLPDLLGDRISGMEFLAQDYSQAVETRVKKKIDGFRQQWYAILQDANQSARIAALSRSITRTSKDLLMKCPACGNMAKLDVEPDVDCADGVAYVCGFYPTSLKCRFCGFFTNEGQEMDYLKLQQIVDELER